MADALIELTNLGDSLYRAEAKPRLLYHYTALDAVLNIVYTGQLWASDVRYLNDSAEINHGLEQFVRAARGLTDLDHAVDPNLVDQLVHRLDPLIVEGPLRPPLFVACFSVDHDLLGQWRGYTPHGRGVSLEFLVSHLDEVADKERFGLAPCIYDQDRQAQVASAAVRIIASVASKQGPAAYESVINAAMPVVVRMAALMKSRGFIDEHEWRLVSQLDHTTAGLYRPGKTTIIPYTSINLRARDAPHIGLNGALVGPTPNRGLSRASLSRFLVHMQACPGACKVRWSAVPYREV